MIDQPPLDVKENCKKAKSIWIRHKLSNEGQLDKSKKRRRHRDEKCEVGQSKNQFKLYAESKRRKGKHIGNLHTFGRKYQVDKVEKQRLANKSEASTGMDKGRRSKHKLRETKWMSSPEGRGKKEGQGKPDATTATKLKQ